MRDAKHGYSPRWRLYATCCVRRQVAELLTQSTNKHWPSVEYVSDFVCVFTGYQIDYSVYYGRINVVVISLVAVFIVKGVMF